MFSRFLRDDEEITIESLMRCVDDVKTGNFSLLLYFCVVQKSKPIDLLVWKKKKLRNNLLVEEEQVGIYDVMMMPSSLDPRSSS